MGIVVSNFILFQEYIDAFLLGFVVSQIFRDSKKRVKKVTQIISDKIIYLSDTFQNLELSYCFSSLCLLHYSLPSFGRDNACGRRRRRRRNLCSGLK